MISFLGVLAFVILANFLVNREIKNKNAGEELKKYIRRRNLILFGGGLALCVASCFLRLYLSAATNR